MRGGGGAIPNSLLVNDPAAETNELRRGRGVPQGGGKEQTPGADRARSDGGGGGGLTSKP